MENLPCKVCGQPTGYMYSGGKKPEVYHLRCSLEFSAPMRERMKKEKKERQQTILNRNQ